MPSIPQTFHSNGKLLLTGEYYVLEGALALAVPTKKGQNLVVTPNETNCLNWQSFDCEGNTWLSASFALPDLQIIGAITPTTTTLQNILQQARQQNPNFLNASQGFDVSTHLEFPRDWGLGSSSTLINNIAQWAGDINPFQLLFDTMGGSGYDIACAAQQQAILYQKHAPTDIQFEPTTFQPSFADQLYFVHLGKKQNSRTGIKHFYATTTPEQRQRIASQITQLTQDICKAHTLQTFEFFLNQHEELISSTLQLPRAKTLYFSDYWGSIKSLGAWGGDFVLASSIESQAKTIAYFQDKGYATVISYGDMVL